jgi:hypothetical protein
MKRDNVVSHLHLSLRRCGWSGAAIEQVLADPHLDFTAIVSLQDGRMVRMRGEGADWARLVNYLSRLVDSPLIESIELCEMQARPDRTGSTVCFAIDVIPRKRA